MINELAGTARRRHNIELIIEARQGLLCYLCVHVDSAQKEAAIIEIDFQTAAIAQSFHTIKVEFTVLPIIKSQRSIVNKYGLASNEAVLC